MILPAIIAFSTAAIFALIGLFVGRKRGDKDPVAPQLSIFAGLFAVWGLFQGLITGGWYVLAGGLTFSRVLIYVIALLSMFTLDLTRRFIRLREVHPVAWLGGIALVGAQIVADALQLPAPTSVEMPLPSLLVSTSAVVWAVLSWRTIQLTIKSYRARNNPLHRNRLSYWGITLLLFTLGEVAYYLSNAAAGNVLFLLGTLNAAYVVSTHRHPDIRLGSLKVLSYLITTSLIVIIYALAYMTTQFIVQVQLGSSPLVAGVIMALVLAILVRPLFGHIQKNIDLVLGQDDTDTNRIIREYSLSISNILNIEQLATVAMGLISEALDNRRGLLFLVNRIPLDQDEYQYKLVSVPGGMGTIPIPTSRALAVDSPIAEYLSQEHRPLIQYDIDFMDRFLSTPLEEKLWFSQLGMDVYLPIYSKGEWIGLLAIGPKETGVPYSEQELNLMSTLADQTSVALENARLVEGLYRINAELEQAYQDLKKTQVELERLDQAKSHFISIASHELRTPLTVIQGYTQMLHEDPKLMNDPYFKNLITGITNGTERLHRIIENMLDVAKIDVRQLELSPVPIPVQSIIRSVCRNLTKVMEERNLKLEVENLKHLRPIEADRDALQKVFYHLINNAIKYTPDGGTITIYGKLLPEGNPTLDSAGVEVVIKDTGIGIDPQNQELIFRKFYRTGEIGLHSTGHTKFKGAGPGLGLAIAQGVVEAHGGKIWVESPGYDEKELPGSQFHVALPLRQNHNPLSGTTSGKE